MKVGVFYPPYNVGNANIQKTFQKGIPNSFIVPDTKYIGCDVLVIFGLVKRSFKKSFAKKDLIMKHCGPVVVVERGYVFRDEYWSVGINGINGHANHNNKGSPSDRWDKLRMELFPWRAINNKNVLVSGQVPWDVSVQDTDHTQWCRETVNQVRRLGFKPIFRPHPYAVERGVDYGVDCEVSNMTMEDDFNRVGQVVTWSSNIAVDAVIRGVPTIAMNNMSMAWSVTGRTLLDLVDPITPDRQQWAHDIAYAQWNLEELRTGEAWQHISRAL